MRVLIVDNFDSFTQNIAHYLRTAAPRVDVETVRNDERWALAPEYLARFDAFVISPGPGHPGTPGDVGISRDVLEDPSRPVLGVCLGHQLIAHLAGADVVPAAEPMHGRPSRIGHDSSELFAGLPAEMEVMRYHSWTVERSSLPASLEPNAWTRSGEIMALRHRDRPHWGVQFHPESIGTPHGKHLLANFLRAARAARAPTASASGRRQVHWREVDGSTDPVRLVESAREFCAVADGVSLLESALQVPGLSRFSYVGVPLTSDERVITYRCADAELTERSLAGELLSRRREPLLGWLEGTLREVEYPHGKPEFGFHGGLVGWLGYELQQETSGIVPSSPSPYPDAAFRSVNALLAVDHERERVYAVVNRPADDTSVEALLEKLGRVAAGASDRADVAARLPRRSDPVRYHSRHSDADYIARIEECHRLIRAGESYELCLTNRIVTGETPDGWALYGNVRRRNPSTFAAYLSIGGVEVISSSPELFVEVDAGRRVRAKPIKGTVRRGETPAEDAALGNWLSGNEKDLAENAMIVDLLRHDLSGVCVPGTVEVPTLAAIESYPAVHQMVSTITGTLAEEKTIVDVLRSCFPGGSMTGAPKIRSMALLDELEGGARGIYSGSLGWISHDGQASLNIVIRSVIVAEGTASIGCGGAITHLSDPHEELEEMKLKSRALLGALAETIAGDPTHFTLDGVPSETLAEAGARAEQPALPRSGTSPRSREHRQALVEDPTP